ncbi:MAG TPA: phosphate signaling complex protein PhoU [Verrucomicrobiota bacterium]|nr:phosphate signaling complex protein PhoU [Verrucomicrobiota bacterium]HRZ36491.1 phosphate signaling complex protein PhoU [Candidatus Paceibacterota bacterium]HRZ57826.1 phosphate signaling complex protein PhoU [Candidatus Paceibacterota bacterium]
MSDNSSPPAAGNPMGPGGGWATSRHEAAIQRDRRRISDSLARMADLAGRAVRDAIQALRTRDRQLAYAVIIRDQAIDTLEEATARLCIEFLVRQQPVATPLRFAYSAVKINTDLERIGDYAESIAHQASKLAVQDAQVPLDRFQELTDLVVPMVHDSVQAFIRQDAALARATIPIENTADQFKSRLRKDLIQMFKDSRLPFEALDPCLTITRRLERVSDQARNICVETLYLCTGEFAQHPDSNTFRILFLDRHNAGASLMAEAMAEAMGQPRFSFSSAGLDPQPCAPAVLEFMREKGLDLGRKHGKALNQVPDLDRYHVVAVLDPQAKKLFPQQAHKIIFLDWPVPDPATVGGPPEAVRAACESAYQALDQQLSALIQAIVGENPA